MKQAQTRKSKRNSKSKRNIKIKKYSTKHRRNRNSSNSRKQHGGGPVGSVLVDKLQQGTLLIDTVDYMKILRDALVGKSGDEMLFLQSSLKLLSLARSNSFFPLLQYDDVVDIIFMYFHKIEPDTYYNIDDVKKFVDACIDFKTHKEQKNSNFVNVNKYESFLSENATIIEEIDFTPFYEALTTYLDARKKNYEERMKAYQSQESQESKD